MTPTPHPLSDAQIAEFWPGADPAEIRPQFDALMAQMRLVWHRSFPRPHELFATVATEKARELPERVATLSAALAGLPEHWRQWQWMADAKPVFGEKYVRSVYGDNGHGMGRQAIAVVPADRYYFGTVADFIAAANPDTVGMLLAALKEAEAARDGPQPWQPIEPEGWFLYHAANEHTRIVYNGDKHEPMPHAEGPWKVEFQRLPHGGRLTGARGKTFREAWENACAAVAVREVA